MTKPIINIDEVFENKKIMRFVWSLNLSENYKKKIMGALPTLTNEEKVFLWKTLIDIYKLDREEKKALENIDRNF